MIDIHKTSQKNLFCFEGCDSGIFLNNGNQIIGQVWDVIININK